KQRAPGSSWCGLAYAAGPQPLGAGPLEVLEIIRVEDNTAHVGVFIVDADPPDKGVGPRGGFGSRVHPRILPKKWATSRRLAIRTLFLTIRYLRKGGKVVRDCLLRRHPIHYRRNPV